MPVDEADVVRLIKETAESPEEKHQLLALAGNKPSLWEGVSENQVVGVLRVILRQKKGRREFLAK